MRSPQGALWGAFSIDLKPAEANRSDWGYFPPSFQRTLNRPPTKSRQLTDLLRFHKSRFRLDELWMGITAALHQRAYTVPAHSLSWNLCFTNMLKKSRGVQACVTPATKDGEGAGIRRENP
jgi:hypothetical protein